MKLLVFSALVGSALAACPNACSGHGKCGEFDSCTCYDNWMGADCSERQCMFGTAWVTTAQGDLNYDGDLNDATVYPTDQNFVKSSVEYLMTDGAKGGTWETWPSTFPLGANAEEGHYYMECSNRGVCDRSSGVCECFEGFTGEACRRTTCPDDCSGNGVCKTIGDVSASYKLWDKDMGQFCQCDKGFHGINCAQRDCPRGDDALTTGQFHTTQYADIHLADGASFGGSIKLTFTDQFGKEWQTDPVAVEPHSSTSAATTAAAKLNALPNDVVRGATASTGFCESSYATTVKVAATTGAVTDTSDVTLTGVSDGDFMRCPSFNSGDVVMYNQGKFEKPAGTVLTAGSTDGTVCHKVTKEHCTRLTVDFGGSINSGNVKNLVASVEGVTKGGNTKHATNSFTVNAAFANSVNLGSMDVTYTAPNTVSCSYDATNCKVENKVVTVTTSGFGNALNERVKIQCGSVVYGTFTIDETVAVTATAFTVVEAIDSCTSGTLKVTRVTDYLTVSSDVSKLVFANNRVSSTATGFGKTSNKVQSTNVVGGVTYIALENGEVAANNYATDDIAQATGDLKLVGEGTTEAHECSDRGLCDSTTGICECFAGYNGYACNLQNAMAA